MFHKSTFSYYLAGIRSAMESINTTEHLLYVTNMYYTRQVWGGMRVIEDVKMIHETIIGQNLTRAMIER